MSDSDLYSSCITATVPGWWVHEDSDTELCWDRWQVSFSGWEGGVPDIILRSSVRTSPLYLGRCCKAEVNTPSMGRNCIPTRHMGAGVWDPLSLWEDSFSPLPLSFGSIFAFSLWRFHHDYKVKSLDCTYLQVFRKTIYSEDSKDQNRWCKIISFNFS